MNHSATVEEAVATSTKIVRKPCTKQAAGINAHTASQQLKSIQDTIQGLRLRPWISNSPKQVAECSIMQAVLTTSTERLGHGGPMFTQERGPQLQYHWELVLMPGHDAPLGIQHCCADIDSQKNSAGSILAQLSAVALAPPAPHLLMPCTAV